MYRCSSSGAVSHLHFLLFNMVLPASLPAPTFSRCFLRSTDLYVSIVLPEVVTSKASLLKNTYEPPILKTVIVRGVLGLYSDTFRIYLHPVLSAPDLSHCRPATAHPRLSDGSLMRLWKGSSLAYIKQHAEARRFIAQSSALLKTAWPAPFQFCS